MYKEIVDIIKSQFPNQDFIPLHEPRFNGNEKKYLTECIDSTFVSSVGAYVNLFEEMMVKQTGVNYAVATVNGTNALQIALLISDVNQNDEVITQSLSFIATANAIKYTGATPIFIDVDKKTIGMSANSLEEFLIEYAKIGSDGFSYNKKTGKRIKACVPMHTFGFPCEIDKIAEICKNWNISLIEDAAESIGSYYKGQHTGSFGDIAIFSFNGNKTITAGGGGCIVTNNEKLAKLAKHLTTQAKIPHKWAFNHDYVGYNYRMPNLNAALACAQLENLDAFIKSKRELANIYSQKLANLNVKFFSEPQNSLSNYWLNVILLKDEQQRNEFLEYSNTNGVMTRPAWNLLHTLIMFNDCQTDSLENSIELANKIVNIPSSPRI